jgi:hypothetical protein
LPTSGLSLKADTGRIASSVTSDTRALSEKSVNHGFDREKQNKKDAGFAGPRSDLLLLLAF